MSGERILQTEETIKTQSIGKVSNSSSKIPGRVDINNLMLKVREEERKQKKKT